VPGTAWPPVTVGSACKVPGPTAPGGFKPGGGLGAAVPPAQAAESEEPDLEEEVTLPDPEFDEVEYKREQIRKGKLAVLNTGWGIFLASIAATLQHGFGFSYQAGWMVLAAGLVGLRAVYRLGGVEEHDWGLKAYFAAGVTLFFSFLAFWYLFLNPPFA